MASSFPGGLDNFTNPLASDTLDSATVPHADQHSNANDAIEAIEGTLGVNPQGGSATVVARLTALDSTVAGKAPASGISPSAITGTAVITTDARLSDTRVPTNASVTDAKIATTLSASKVTGTAVTQADTGTVTSAMIANGTIVDADVSASAAIATSKVSGLDTALAGKVASVTAADSTITVAGTSTAPTVKVGTVPSGQVSGLGTASTKDVPATGNASSTQVVYGTDTRLTDTRTPTAHASTHGVAGSDAVTVAQSQVTNLTTDLGNKVNTSSVGAASGVASLDGSGLVPTSQIPPLAISDTFVVASQAAMLALTAQVGDVAVRTDVTKTFILQASPASTLANWIQILTPPAVTAITASAPLTGGTITSTGSIGLDQTALAITSSQVSGLATSATTDTTNASNITSGTLLNARLVSVPNSALANSSVTVNGSAISLGNSATVTATPTDATVTDAKIATAGLAQSSLTSNVIANWAASTVYARNDLVNYLGVAYRRISAGTSGATFDPANWNAQTPALSSVASNITGIPNSATTATNANTASAIVARDASGNFSAGTVTASLTGNASTATNLAAATTTLASTVTASSLTSFGTNPTLAGTSVTLSSLGAGVIHANASGVLSSSSVVGSDISTATTVQVAGLGIGVAAPATGISLASGNKLTTASNATTAGLKIVSTGAGDPSSVVQGDLWAIGSVSNTLRYSPIAGSSVSIAYADASNITNVAKLASANAFTVGGHTIANASDQTALSLSTTTGAQASALLTLNNVSSSMSGNAINSFGNFVVNAAGRVGVRTTSLPASLNVDASTATNVAQQIRGASSQTADLLQFQSSTSTVLGGRNAVGQIFSGSTTPITSTVGGATTATSGDGTTATITTTAATNLAVGDIVIVAGVTPTGYNTTGAVVTAVSNTSTFTVSYANTTTGSQTVAGTVTTPYQTSITARSAGTRGLAIRGATTTATGFANPFTIQDSVGASLLQVTSAGNLQANGLQTINSYTSIGEENSGARVRLTSATATPTAFATGGTIYTQGSTLRYLGSSGTGQTILGADGSNALITNRLLADSSAITVTTLQNIFTTGTLTLEPSTSYAFRLVGAVNRGTVTASTLAVRLTMSSTPTTYRGSEYTLSPTAGASALHTTNIATSEAQINVSTAAGTATTTLRFFYEGFFTTSSTASQTLIPQFVQDVNVSSVIQAGTYFELIKVGTAVGAWA